MSAVTDFLNQSVKPICNTFFEDNAHKYDMKTQEGCGKYTEALVKHLRADYDMNEAGHLKKSSSQTQYNGHAIDAFLWNEGDPTLLRAVDVIASAESPNASAGFGIDDPRYTEADWFLVDDVPVPVNDLVPYVAYPGDASNNELKRTLAFDYARRPQGADWDVSVWAFRVQHSNLMGPIPPSHGGHPLGMLAAVDKHRPEWCAALGVPVIPVPPNWNIGDPV